MSPQPTRLACPFCNSKFAAPAVISDQLVKCPNCEMQYDVRLALQSSPRPNPRRDSPQNPIAPKSSPEVKRPTAVATKRPRRPTSPPVLEPARNSAKFVIIGVGALLLLQGIIFTLVHPSVLSNGLLCVGTLAIVAATFPEWSAALGAVWAAAATAMANRRQAAAAGRQQREQVERVRASQTVTVADDEADDAALPKPPRRRSRIIRRTGMLAAALVAGFGLFIVVGMLIRARFDADAALQDSQKLHDELLQRHRAETDRILRTVGAAPEQRFVQRVREQVAEDAIKQYEIAERNGNKIDIYVRDGLVAEAYLQAKDEENYRKWKHIRDLAAIRAGIPVD